MTAEKYIRYWPSRTIVLIMAHKHNDIHNEKSDCWKTADRIYGDLVKGWWWRDFKITTWLWTCNAAGKRSAGLTTAWLIFLPYLIVAEYSPYYTLTSGLMVHYILALGLRSRVLWVILWEKISYWFGNSVVGVFWLGLFLLILHFNFQLLEVTICKMWKHIHECNIPKYWRMLRDVRLIDILHLPNVSKRDSTKLVPFLYTEVFMYV